MNDKKMFKWMAALIIAPIALAVFGGDRFRYPCQDPDNWDKKECQKPTCEATRTCPEHIFKGTENEKIMVPNKPVVPKPSVETGGECGQ